MDVHEHINDVDSGNDAGWLGIVLDYNWMFTFFTEV